ncbi:MAG: acyl-CoA dehydrogenase, partial [Tannerella sp.]|nr:acyl-CoA dehydrogenase [Tannerella sp.]
KPELNHLKKKLIGMTAQYDEIVKLVTETKDNEYLDFQARRLVEAATYCIMGYLILQDADKDEAYQRSAEIYIRYGEAETAKIYSYITAFKVEDLGHFRAEI